MTSRLRRCRFSLSLRLSIPAARPIVFFSGRPADSNAAPTPADAEKPSNVRCKIKHEARDFSFRRICHVLQVLSGF
jgi:hypothetical protein